MHLCVLFDQFGEEMSGPGRGVQKTGKKWGERLTPLGRILNIRIR